MKVWALTDGPVKEGKYLVVRRDGTVPTWPHFVIGGDDPCAYDALQAYALAAERRGYEADYVASVRELSLQFAHRAASGQGKADPDQGPHRTDLPIVIAMMRHEVDLTHGVKAIAFLEGKRAAAVKALEGILSVLREGFAP